MATTVRDGYEPYNSCLREYLCLKNTFDSPVWTHLSCVDFTTKNVLNLCFDRY